MSATTFTVADDKRTLIAERTFPAPKSRVWEAYARPELLAQWWGPRGWETEIRHMDFSDGGTRAVTSTRYETPEALEQLIAMGMEEGFSQTWDRLEELLVQSGEK